MGLKKLPSRCNGNAFGPVGGSRGGVKLTATGLVPGFLLGWLGRSCQWLLLLPSVITCPSTPACFLASAGLVCPLLLGRV